MNNPELSKKSSVKNISRIKDIQEVLRKMGSHDIRNLLASDHRLRDAGLCRIMMKTRDMRLDILINSLGNDDAKWTEVLNKHKGMQEWLEKWKHNNEKGKKAKKTVLTKTPAQVALSRLRRRKKRARRAKGPRVDEEAEESEHETREQKDRRRSFVKDWIGIHEDEIFDGLLET